MTNYEDILNMSIEKMAVMLVETCIFKENEFIEKLKEAGIDFAVIQPIKEFRYAKMKKWLESEVQSDDR